jgi:aminoglycoside 6'-N-acetyltransferase I
LILDFQQVYNEDQVPLDLLLLADPSIEVINQYVKQADIYIAILQGKTVGVFVLHPNSKSEIEIKNIAVDVAFQNKGIGKAMMQKAEQIARSEAYNTLCIGTANSSIQPLYFYQKQGFEFSSIKENFFIQNYNEAIFENGIQAKHLIMLKKHLK